MTLDYIDIAHNSWDMRNGGVIDKVHNCVHRHCKCKGQERKILDTSIDRWIQKIHWER